MSSYDESANGVRWRLQSLESRMTSLEAVKPDVIAERVARQASELQEVRDEISALKKALYTFALSISASAVAFAFVVFQVIRP